MSSLHTSDEISERVMPPFPGRVVSKVSVGRFTRSGAMCKMFTVFGGWVEVVRVTSQGDDTLELTVKML